MLVNVLDHKVDRLAMLSVPAPFAAAEHESDLGDQPFGKLGRTLQLRHFARYAVIREDIVNDGPRLIESKGDNAPQLPGQHADVGFGDAPSCSSRFI